LLLPSRSLRSPSNYKFSLEATHKAGLVKRQRMVRSGETSQPLIASTLENYSDI
jgi:hypothetical protein